MRNSSYIFITGGVISGLGKGVTAASVAATLLEMGHRRVTIRKIDPYLNVDPGVLSPYEHGEVFVTEDGAETDLDLGHYERFTEVPTGQQNATSFGKLMQHLLNKERTGDYLGKTVQLIPHFTDTIIDYIRKDEDQYDFILCEVGGSAGDIEAMPFLEAVRQLRRELGPARCMLLFVTYLLYYPPTQELKTKPTQDAVRRLLQAGLQPDALVCRTEHSIAAALREKLSLFTNVPENNILEAITAENIYQLPLLLAEEGLSKVLTTHFQLPTAPPPALQKWHDLQHLRAQATQLITVGFIGKYVELHDAYYSLLSAIEHAGWHLGKRVEVRFINARAPKTAAQELAACDQVMIPGGFGGKGTAKIIDLIQQARELGKPTLGICFGMQLMVIEYARNVLGMTGATSRELATGANEPIVVDLMEQFKSEAKGGTMRLGAQEVLLQPDSRIQAIYGQERTQERHRHRYEVDLALAPKLEAQGLHISGHAEATGLPEVVERRGASFYVGVQYHPEFKSTPFHPHPLLLAWLQA